MQEYLCTHPKVVNWPPLTSGSRGLGDTFAMPNEGTLVGVKLDPASEGRPKRLWIFKMWRGQLSSGRVLAAEPGDHSVLVTLADELRKFRGVPIATISNLKFDL